MISATYFNRMEPCPNWSDKIILVVEDDEINRFFFKSALRKTAAQLIYAHNGIEAIEQTMKNDKIDLILMDIRMPLMNGFEATKEIRKQNKELPIIVQSAYTLSQEKEQAYDAGCNDFISKPINIKKLLELIQQYL